MCFFLVQRVIQSQALQDRNVADQQQWDSATKFMENAVRTEFEQQKSSLEDVEDKSSWRKFLGLRQKTIEENNRQNCAKELQKLFLIRKQLEGNQVRRNVFLIFSFHFFSFRLAEENFGF